jgi:hypothetical protein
LLVKKHTIFQNSSNKKIVLELSWNY